MVDSTTAARLRRRAAGAFRIGVIGVAAFAQQVQPAFSQTDLEHTYLTGDELAQRVLENVVLIENIDSGQMGAGMIVGSDRDSLYILTARHVVQHGDVQPTADSRLHVRFCNDPSGQQTSTDRGSVVFDDASLDAAAIRISTLGHGAPVVRLLAGAAVITGTGEEIWSIGREGGCKIGSGHIDQPEDGNGIFIADIPGGYGGTSGSPVSTVNGAIAIVLSNPGAAKVKMRSIRQIRRAIELHRDFSWSLEDSHNIAPLSVEAVANELPEVLNAYLFRLKDVRDSLVRETYKGDDLKQRIDAYNAAIGRFKGIENKYDGSLVRLWGQSVFDAYGGVRDDINTIHATILGFNDWTTRLTVAGHIVPKAIRTQMTAMKPAIGNLEKAKDEFLAQLKEGGRNVQP